MIYLKSQLDGFKVILGNYLLHACYLVTLLLAIRPPDYPPTTEDETKLSEKGLYWLLVGYHFILMVISFCETWTWPSRFREWAAIGTIFAICLVIYICQEWVFF